MIEIAELNKNNKNIPPALLKSAAEENLQNVKNGNILRKELQIETLKSGLSALEKKLFDLKK